MASYILHWRGGDTQVVHGRTVAEAMTLAGLGQGAVAALDYWERAEDDTGLTDDDIKRLAREAGMWGVEEWWKDQIPRLKKFLELVDKERGE